MSYQCFKKGCKGEAQFVCLCLSPDTFCCETHLKEHLKIPKRNHAFDTVLSELNKWTKDGILRFLTAEKLKKTKLKTIALAAFTKNTDSHKISVKKSQKDLDLDLKEISALIIKMSQASEEEEASLLNSIALPLDFDIEGIEAMLPNDSENNLKLFCRLDRLQKKIKAILNSSNNDLKTEQDFRKICELYKNNANHWLLRQAYKEYINAYKNMTSLYRVWINSKGINFSSYDTEIERENVRILENPYEEEFDIYFTIQIPNGEIFVFGYNHDPNNYEYEVPSDTSFAVIIDRNYKVRKWPIKNFDFFTSGIYFNRNIYCFGWRYLKKYNTRKNYFMRFDLDENRWIDIAQILVRY